MPQVPSVVGSEGAVGMGGYSKRCSCPEHSLLLPFSLPLLFQRDEASQHPFDNIAHPTEIPHEICERTDIDELHDILQ